MREEEALRRVQRLNLMHLIFRERKVEHIKILFHAFFFYRFGNDGHAALHEEAQSRLCGSFAIMAANCFQYFVCKTCRFFLLQTAPTILSVCHIFSLKHVQFSAAETHAFLLG